MNSYVPGRFYDVILYCIIKTRKAELYLNLYMSIICTSPKLLWRGNKIKSHNIQKCLYIYIIRFDNSYLIVNFGF